MGRLILLDTSELLRPLPRKLHAAWAEIDGRKATMSPTVGLELAPHGLLATTSDGLTTAERLLQRETPKLSKKRQLQLEIQAWWSDAWRNPESPYQLLEMNEALEDRVTELANSMDPKCFRGATPGYVADHHDARIVCESMVLGASLLLTSNMRSIKRQQVNEWAIANGERLGFEPKPVIYPADGTLMGWTRSQAGLEKWLQAGLIACWPRNYDASPREVINKTIDEVERMAQGSGGKLRRSAQRLANGLRNHPSPERLVEQTRERFPSPTITSDRKHPTYPQAPEPAEAPKPAAGAAAAVASKRRGDDIPPR